MDCLQSIHYKRIMKMRNCHFLMILTFTFDIYFTEGFQWITEPLPVNKCKGQTANFTWEYVKEPGEVITQLQWIFNRTTLIAYSSMNQGFNVMPNYQGRVSQSGENGILLHNISSKDIGDYTLYPLIKWEESPNIQTVRLNVIEAATMPDCLCEKISDFPEVRNGETYKIAIGSCNLEINSSFCCPVGLVSQYCVDDPLKFCTPIRNSNNVTESTTQSSNVTRKGDKTVPNDNMRVFLSISLVGVAVLLVIIGMLLVRQWRKNPSNKIDSGHVSHVCVQDTETEVTQTELERNNLHLHMPSNKGRECKSTMRLECPNKSPEDTFRPKFLEDHYTTIDDDALTDDNLKMDLVIHKYSQESRRNTEHVHYDYAYAIGVCHVETDFTHVADDTSLTPSSNCARPVEIFQDEGNEVSDTDNSYLTVIDDSSYSLGVRQDDDTVENDVYKTNIIPLNV